MSDQPSLSGPIIPDGFAPHTRRSPFTDPLEPLFARQDDRQLSLGTVLREVHCNSSGLVHGGFIATLSDNAMGLTCAHALARDGRKIVGMVTVNLSIDYVGQAKIGDWLETESEVVKLGGSLVFVTAILRTDALIVARANATFKIRTA